MQLKDAFEQAFEQGFEQIHYVSLRIWFKLIKWSTDSSKELNN